VLVKVQEHYYTEIVALPFKKNKPGSLGESSTVSKEIVGDLDNMMCEDKLIQQGKVEWGFKYLSTLKVPAKKQK